MGRWGLEMQDDITDALNHFVEAGVTNPEKVCIFGASYGSYAAKMATVKTPDLFTCAVSFAGVSDLSRLAKTLNMSSSNMAITICPFNKIDICSLLN